MGYTTGKELHINVPLSNIAINYQDTIDLAGVIAPIVRVQKQADSYYKFSVAEAYAIENDVRAPGTEPNRITRSVTSETYFCKNYALADFLTYEDAVNVDAGLILTSRESRTRWLKRKLIQGNNYRLSLQCTSGSNVGSYSAVGSNWSDGTTGHSAPYTDIKTAINNVCGVIGEEYRNDLTIVFGKTAWQEYRDHADIRTLVYGTAGTGPNGRIVKQEQVKELHEVKRVYVANAMYNTVQEGQTASLSCMWDVDVLICYTPDQPSIDVPSFMYTFMWPRVMDMQAMIHQVPRSYREDIHVGWYLDNKITCAQAGFIISDVRSSV